MAWPTRLAIVIPLIFTPVLAGVVQKPGLIVPNEYAVKRDDVKQIFETSYRAYKSVAFGHDDLLPTSQSSADWFGGWGASIVDSMSTGYIMGFTDQFQEAVNFSSNIDFSKAKSGGEISLFETTIRYLGSLLSVYQLNNNSPDALLTKATELADKLAFAWVGDNDIPYNTLDFSTNSVKKENNNIAQAGALILEWRTLSQLTGNRTYGRLAEKALRRIVNNVSPLPGLAAQGINPADGSPVGGYVTLI